MMCCTIDIRARPPLYYPKNYFKQFRPCKIVTEHQTKELDDLKLTNSTLGYLSDYFLGKLLRKQSDAIIGVTDEITQYEITRARDPEKPHLTIGNGFSIQSVPVRGLRLPRQRTSSPLRRQCQPLARARPAYQGYQHA